MSTAPDDLLALAPNCSITHFYCDNEVCTHSYQRCTTLVTDWVDYEWSLKLHCQICQSVWWLCCSCTLRKKIERHAILLRHKYSCHNMHKEYNHRRKINEQVNDDNEVNTIETNFVCPDTVDVTIDINSNNDEKSVDQMSHDGLLTRNNTNMVDMDTNKLDMVLHITDKDCEMENKNLMKKYSKSMNAIIDLLMKEEKTHRVNENTSNFYSYDLCTSGSKYLIAKMLSSQHGTLDDVFNSLTKEEVNCQLMLSEFCRSLTRSQQSDFSNVVNNIMDVYATNCDTAICNLPRSFADVRRMYTNGAKSVTKLLPIPNVRRLKNHSYVSLLDIISDFLFSTITKLKVLQDYHENTLDHENRNILSLFNTERMREIK